uniref:Uncharacterized protein n=1 Tax=Anguilla anguilla TaxID=7936 RepID=A0A0E9UL88_ANGAN
MPHKITVE